MLTLDAVTKKAAALPHPKRNWLIDFDETLKVTSASYPITADGNSYINQSKAGINVTGISPIVREERIKRSIFGIEIEDEADFKWKKYFDTPDFRKRVITCKIIYNDSGTLSPTLQFFKGNLAAVSHNYSASGRKIVLELIDKLVQVDGRHSAVTTKDNQRSRDPTDASFDQVGVLKELSWGKR